MPSDGELPCGSVFNYTVSQTLWAVMGVPKEYLVTIGWIGVELVYGHTVVQ